MSIYESSISNPKKQLEFYKDLSEQLQRENERLLKIAKKMHLYIFLHTTDEQNAYDEIGLTDEENAILGYSGEFVLKEVE